MYSAFIMLDLGYVREHLDLIEKMARDRGVTLDLAAFRAIDSERRSLIVKTEQLKAERNQANADNCGPEEIRAGCRAGARAYERGFRDH